MCKKLVLYVLSCVKEKKKKTFVLDIDDQSAMYVLASKRALVAYLNQHINLFKWCTWRIFWLHVGSLLIGSTKEESM